MSKSDNKEAGFQPAKPGWEVLAVLTACIAPPHAPRGGWASRRCTVVLWKGPGNVVGLFGMTEQAKDSARTTAGKNEARPGWRADNADKPVLTVNHVIREALDNGVPHVNGDAERCRATIRRVCQGIGGRGGLSEAERIERIAARVKADAAPLVVSGGGERAAPSGLL